MRVLWTDRARRHLRAIHDYIAQDSNVAAKRMVDRLTRKSHMLVDFPNIGHVVPEYETDPTSLVVRQILEGNYRIIYRVNTRCIEIVAVIHGAQQLPPLQGLS